MNNGPIPTAPPEAVMPLPRLPLAARTVLGALQLGVYVGGRLAPAATGEWAHKRYFTPMRRAAGSNEIALEAEGERFVERFRSPAGAPFPVEGEIIGHSWGSGAPVLFVHGWEGRGTLLAKAFVRPLLDRGYRVVTVDLPGHGQSVGERTDVVSMAAAVGQLGERFGPMRAVVGHSLGGAAATIALSRGFRAERAALLSPIVWMRPLPERFARAIRLTGAARRAFDALLFESFADPLWDELTTVALAPSMTVPALIVQSADDDDTWAPGAETLAARWPGARLVHVDGLGHYRLLGDGAVVEQVVGFATT